MKTLIFVSLFPLVMSSSIPRELVTTVVEDSDRVRTLRLTIGDIGTFGLRFVHDLYADDARITEARSGADINHPPHNIWAGFGQDGRLATVSIDPESHVVTSGVFGIVSDFFHIRRRDDVYEITRRRGLATMAYDRHAETKNVIGSGTFKAFFPGCYPGDSRGVDVDIGVTIDYGLYVNKGRSMVELLEFVDVNMAITRLVIYAQMNVVHRLQMIICHKHWCVNVLSEKKREKIKMSLYGWRLQSVFRLLGGLGWPGVVFVIRVLTFALRKLPMNPHGL